MNNIFILRLLNSYDSIITKVSILVGYLIFFIFTYIILFNNPFTSDTHKIYVEDQYKHPTKEEVIKSIDNEKIYKVKGLSKYEYYIVSDTSNIDIGLVEVYDYNYDSPTSASEDDEIYEDILISDLMDNDVHPLPYFSKSITNNDIFILGTSNETRPKEVLNEIVRSFKNTFYLTIFSIAGFLFFGLALGIINGYYKYNKFSIVFNLLQKTIESVPLLLWVLMSCLITDLIINTASNDYQSLRWPIVYLLFGIFSSTALSKLIMEKIDSLREQEFVVALKLLGLPDSKIIFNHIIRFYCSDIIVLQLINIISQSIFLNITLCIIKFQINDTIGMIFYRGFYFSKGLDMLIVVSTIIYFIMNSLFYTANYLKGRINA